MNDFFTEETPADVEVNAAEEQEMRAKIQAEIFDGVPAEFDPETKDESKPEAKAEADVDPEVEATLEPAPGPAPLSPEMQAIVNSVNKLSGSISGMENRLKQTERRVGGISTEFHAAKEAAATQAKAPTPEEMAVAAKDAEAWEDLKKDFPSWATAINSKISAQADKFVSVDDFEALRKSVAKTPTVDTSQLEIRLVGLIHPDHKQIVQDPAYATWLTGQPDNIQQLAYKGTTAEEAITVFNKFKAHKAPELIPSSEVKDIKAQRAARLAASTTTNTKHKTIKTKTQADMTESELRADIAKKVFA